MERRRIDGMINAVIKPVLGEEYEVIASHIISSNDMITDEIITLLDEADLVVADLTDKNANVMYELGIRDCTGKPTIQIHMGSIELPFDKKNQRTIPYKDDILGTGELIQEFEKCFKKIDFDKIDINPVTSAITNKNIFDTIKRSSTPEDAPMIDAIGVIVNKLDNLENELHGIKMYNNPRIVKSQRPKYYGGEPMSIGETNIRYILNYRPSEKELVNMLDIDAFYNMLELTSSISNSGLLKMFDAMDPSFRKSFRERTFFERDRIQSNKEQYMIDWGISMNEIDSRLARMNRILLTSDVDI